MITPPFFYVVATNAVCTNRVAGALVEKYVLKTATLKEVADFHNHCIDCLYCSVQVRNVRVTHEASDYYGILPGPGLDKHLKEVRVDEPPRMFMQATRGAARRISRWKPRGETTH